MSSSATRVKTMRRPVTLRSGVSCGAGPSGGTTPSAPGRNWDQAIEQALAQVAESGANHGQILAAPVVNGLSRAKVLGVRKNGGVCCLALSTDGHHAVAHEKQNLQVIDSSVTICVSP